MGSNALWTITTVPALHQVTGIFFTQPPQTTVRLFLWVLLLNCPSYTSCFFFAEHRSPTIITIRSVLLPRRVNTFLTDFALHSHGNGIMEMAAIIEGDNIYAISIQITITYTMQTCLQVL